MAKPVYALVGEDVFLQLQALEQVLAALPKDVDRIDYEGERAELAPVLDDLRSFAMFGGGKLVIVRDADDFLTRYRAQLEDYVAEPSSSGTLVLRLSSLPSNQRIYKAIQKVGQIIPCAAPKEKDLPAWIMQRAKNPHQLNFTLEAANLLAELIGADLGRLDNELAKLALQFDDAKITPKQINEAVAFQREQAMWQMTDELTAGRPTDALRRWRHLVQLDPSTEFRAFTWLTIWLEKLVRASQMNRKRVNSFTIAKELKIWPANNVENLLRTAEELGDRGMRQAVDLLTDLDQRSKSGLGDASTNVERFILSLGSA